MGMFSKIGKKALGGIGGLFRSTKKAGMTATQAVKNPKGMATLASQAIKPPVAMDPTATPSNVPMATPASQAIKPPVAMDPTATPSNVPMAPQPADSPFAAAATAAMAKMPAKKAMVTPAVAPGKRRFGQMIRNRAF